MLTITMYPCQHVCPESLYKGAVPIEVSYCFGLRATESTYWGVGDLHSKQVFLCGKQSVDKPVLKPFQIYI